MNYIDYFGDTVPFSSRYKTFEDWKKAQTKDNRYTRRIIKSHKKHPTQPLKSLRGHAKDRPKKKKRPPPPPPIQKSYRYDVKYNISYVSKEPHQTRHGNLMGTVVSPYPLDVENIYQIMLRDAGETREWLDGVKPNRHSTVYIRQSTTDTIWRSPHAENVRVQNTARF